MVRDQQFVRAEEAPDAGGSWVLTDLDRANLVLTLRGLWLFDAELDAAVLRRGLARLLVHYPHLAGRMHRGRKVDLVDAGVPFEVAAVPDLTLEQLEADHRLAAPLAPPLRKGRVRRGADAPLSVRVTHLEDGSVLGVRCSHAWLDGNGFYTMVRNWARCCRGEPFPAPVLDPGCLPPLPDRSRAELRRRLLELGWRRPSWTKLVASVPALAPSRLLQRTAPIPLSAAALDHLRETATRATGGARVSRGLALAAQLTWMATRLHGIPAGTPCEQVVVVDARERVESIPPAYAANAVMQVRGAAFQAGAPFEEIARRCHEALAPMVCRPSPSLAEQQTLAREVMRHRVPMLPYDAGALHSPRPTVSYLNDFSRMPIYDVDLGTTEHPLPPRRAIPHDLPDPWLIWPAPPGQDGVELYLTGVPARAWEGRG